MRSKTLLVGAGVVLGVLLSTAVVLAGGLNPSVGPTGAASQMYTLEQIYQCLSGGGTATKMTAFTEPSSGPGTSTMHTLDDLLCRSGLLPARVFFSPPPPPEDRTDHVLLRRRAYDGDLDKGVAWPNPRLYHRYDRGRDRHVDRADVAAECHCLALWEEQA